MAFVTHKDPTARRMRREKANQTVGILLLTTAGIISILEPKKLQQYHGHALMSWVIQ
jgi:hypothetical protein